LAFSWLSLTPSGTSLKGNIGSKTSGSGSGSSRVNSGNIRTDDGKAGLGNSGGSHRRRKLGLDARISITLLISLLVKLHIGIGALSCNRLRNLLARCELDRVSWSLGGGERVDANGLVEFVRGGSGETTGNVRGGLERQLLVLGRLLKSQRTEGLVLAILSSITFSSRAVGLFSKGCSPAIAAVVDVGVTVLRIAAAGVSGASWSGVTKLFTLPSRSGSLGAD